VFVCLTSETFSRFEPTLPSCSLLSDTNASAFVVLRLRLLPGEDMGLLLGASNTSLKRLSKPSFEKVDVLDVCGSKVSRAEGGGEVIPFRSTRATHGLNPKTCAHTLLSPSILAFLPAFLCIHP
jgi:hypothetical protein